MAIPFCRLGLLLYPITVTYGCPASLVAMGLKVLLRPPPVKGSGSEKNAVLMPALIVRTERKKRNELSSFIRSRCTTSSNAHECPASVAQTLLRMLVTMPLVERTSSMIFDTALCFKLCLMLVFLVLLLHPLTLHLCPTHPPPLPLASRRPP